MRYGILAVVVATTMACGGAESFGEDGSEDGGDVTDTAVETPEDVVTDVPEDVPADTPTDTAIDSTVDPTLDTPADTGFDTADVIADTLVDPVDTPVDTGCDPSIWRVYNSTDTPVAIPDDDAMGVESSVTVDGCPAEVLDLTVDVHVTHGFIGDLTLVLIAPSGDRFYLHDGSGGSEDDIDTTYPTLTAPDRSMCALLPQDAVGSWRLLAIDDMPGDSGVLQSWSLSVRGIAGTCPTDGYTSADTFPISIPDNDYLGIESDIIVPDSGAIGSVAVFVQIEHEWIGDLLVYLESPTGTDVVLHDRTGGSANDIFTIYPVETTPEESLGTYAGTERHGTWTLHVADTEGAFTGQLMGWELFIE